MAYLRLSPSPASCGRAARLRSMGSAQTSRGTTKGAPICASTYEIGITLNYKDEKDRETSCCNG